MRGGMYGSVFFSLLPITLILILPSSAKISFGNFSNFDLGAAMFIIVVASAIPGFFSGAIFGLLYAEVKEGRERICAMLSAHYNQSA